MAESLKNTTVLGVGWSIADTLSYQGVTFLVGMVLARLLTPEEYGLIGIITIFIIVFDAIVDGGFSNALIRKNDADDLDYSTVFFANLVVSLLLAALLFFSSPAIGSFFKQPQLVPLTKVMSTIIIINAFAIIQRTILVKRIDFKTQTKCSFTSSIIGGAVGIGMALSGFGVWSLVGQQISMQLVRAILLWCLTRWYPKLQYSWCRFKELFSFGWKLLVSSIISTLWNQIYQVVIGKFYNPASLGQFTRAQQFSTICSSNLTAVVQRVSYPVLSTIQDDKPRLKEAYRRVIKTTVLMSFVLMLGMAAVAKSMIQVLIGDQWLPAVPYLQIICLYMMLYPLHAINLNMLQVQGRSDLYLKLEILKKSIAVIPVLLGIFVSIYWMLAGCLVTDLFAFYLNAHYSGPFISYSFKDQVKDILPSLGIAMTMALPVFCLSFLPVNPFLLLPLQIIAGAMITIALCEKVKLEEYEELREIAIGFLQKVKHI